jgi:hypothetical protein
MEEIKRSNAGLSQDQRLARLEKGLIIGDAKEKSQAAKAAENASDEAWVNTMLQHVGQAEKPVEVLSEDDQQWIDKMLSYGGQKK